MQNYDLLAHKMDSSLLWIFLLLSFTSEQFLVFASDCPSQCTCANMTDFAELSVTCIYVLEIPATFPSNTKEIFITTTGRPDILNGTFTNLPWLERVSVTGDIGTIQSGAFSNLHFLVNIGTQWKQNSNSYLNFTHVDIKSIEENAFYNISGFAAFTLLSFKISKAHSRSFNEISNIDEFALRRGMCSEFPIEMFHEVHNIFSFIISSVEVPKIKKRAFKGSNNVKRFEVEASKFQELDQDAFGYMTCIKYFKISSCEIHLLKNFAFFDLNDVSLFEIKNNTILQKETKIFEGMGRVARFELQEDLVILTPEQSPVQMSECQLQVYEDPCSSILCFDSMCRLDSSGRPYCPPCNESVKGCIEGDYDLRPTKIPKSPEELFDQWKILLALAVIMITVAVAGIAAVTIVIQTFTRQEICVRSPSKRRVHKKAIHILPIQAQKGIRPEVCKETIDSHSTASKTNRQSQNSESRSHIIIELTSESEGTDGGSIEMDTMPNISENTSQKDQ